MNNTSKITYNTNQTIKQLQGDMQTRERELFHSNMRAEIAEATKPVSKAVAEVKSTAKGVQTFDLPQHLKRDTTQNRARKDNYTTLMLGNWAVKRYYDMMNIEEDVEATFSPILI